MKRLILKIRTKLRSPRGETLGEVLVALLVAALAITMLAGAIGVSTRLVMNSKEAVAKYYNSNSELSAQSATSTSENVTVSSGATDIVSFGVEIVKDKTQQAVTYYSNTKYDTVMSYQKR